MDVAWFKARKRELKINDVAIGMAIGRDRSVANRIINGTLPLDMNHVEPLAKILQVSREDILRRAGVLDVTSDKPETNALPIEFEGASFERPRNDLPVFGTALGAVKIVDGEAVEQTTLNQGEIISYAKRPVFLNGVKDAYSLYVQGSSMEPVWFHGKRVVVQRNRPPSVGDDVVVYLRSNGNDQEADDGIRARTVLIKRLVRRTAHYVELQQFEPAIIFRIPAEDVLRTDRVVPYDELLE